VHFKSDIQAVKDQGRRVFISIGGADAPIAVTPSNNATFASTLKV
jgi:chitinase